MEPVLCIRSLYSVLSSPEIDSYRIGLSACAVLWNGRKWRGIAYSCERQLVETWVAAAAADS